MTSLHFIFLRRYVVFVFVMARCGSLVAQQNLFNIPAGDLTPKHKFFFQQQTNLYAFNNLEAKNHLVYGLGSGWEVGANVLNLKMDFRPSAAGLPASPDRLGHPLSPLVQLTVQKFFFIGEKFKTTVGTQLGTNPWQMGRNARVTHFSYNTWVYEPRSHVKVIFGPYWSDRNTVGRGNTAGWLAGFEFPVSRKLLVMGDFISGRNATSVSVLGVNFLASRRVQLCLGGMLPNPGSGNKAGLVFELNLLGFDSDPSH